MLKSDDLLLVSLLSKGGSIAAVAREMHLTPSAISQRLSLLEQRLQMNLAERFGRSGVRLTAEGEFLAEKAADVIGEIALIQDQLGERRGVLNGVIRITAPFGFGRRHVAPALAEFHKLHSQISVNLKLSDDLSHPPPNAWDILIRVSPWVDSTLIATSLCDNRRLVCASPKYVAEHGAPSHPEELRGHACISISEDGAKGSFWQFQRKDGAQAMIKVAPRFTTNDGETALEWAIAGCGIIVRSQWSTAAALEAGDLIELLPDWTAPDAPIVALTSVRNAGSLRIQTVLTHLLDSIEV